MKSVRTLLKFSSFFLACGILLLTGCNILSSNESNDLKISLSDRALSQGEALDYTISNNKGNPVYIYINGSVTNIEKNTNDGWTRLINTLPHRPSYIAHELKPNETFEKTITYDLVKQLVDNIVMQTNKSKLT